MNQNGADADLAEEIAITAVNDSRLYRWAKSIIINYARKRVKGEYNRELAIKGFVPVAEAGVKEIRQYGYIPPVSMATKRLAAAEILDHYEDEILEMTQKMQGVRDTGKPWQRRNAEGKEWFSVAKKGRGQAKRGRIPCAWCGIPIPEPPEDATFDELLCDRCNEKYEQENDLIQPWRLRGKQEAKTSRKPKEKPAASFGGIPLKRLW